MRLPTFRRIFKTDYPEEQQSLVEKLSVTINDGFEQLYNAFTRNISVRDNIFCTVKNVEITVDSTGRPLNQSNAGFKLDTVGTITGISVVRATNLTNSIVYPTGGVFISYSQDTGNISILNVAGLPANNKFQLVIIAWG